ncbi:MAG TPA: PEP-CTERM sorting domain-containing protein [Rheinheimera sp.]|uniref:PEP-CTERM sorting domain-containing protein n=1 Tax=Rheinheimera sp. TaxID=1869214 RepID=UPI002F959404
MKYKFLKSAVAGFALAVSGFANAAWIEINFADLTQNTQYANYAGVEFDLIGGLDSSGDPFVTTGGIHNSNNSWYPTAQILQFSFSTLVEEISFILDNYGSGNGSFWTAFGTDNSVLETGSFSSGGGAFSLSATNVAYIQFNNNQPSSNWNFQVSSFSAREIANVPEPSTLAILALGVMGLASRKFKKQA